MEQTSPSIESACSKVPIELAEEIFEFAIRLPKEFGIAEWTGKYDPLDLGRMRLALMALNANTLKLEVKNRLNYALVCRQWYQIMLKFLYQSVIIKNYDQMQDLFQQITRTPEIALLIRRIDVLCIDRNNDPRHIETLQRIFDACTNLVFLADSSNHSNHPCAGFIVESCKNYDFSNIPIKQLLYNPVSGVFIYLSPISSFTHLRALALYGKLGHSFPLPAQIPIPFLQLDILDIAGADFYVHSIASYLAKCLFPRLHSVTASAGKLCPDALQPFWTKIGPQLRTLCIIDWTTAKAPYPDQYPGFLLIVPSFSNLQQLAVSIWINDQLLLEFAKLPHIRRLEIYWDVVPLDHFIFQSDITELFSNLESFCVANTFADVQDQTTKHVLDNLVKYLEVFEQTIRSRGILLKKILKTQEDEFEMITIEDIETFSLSR